MQRDSTYFHDIAVTAIFIAASFSTALGSIYAQLWMLVPIGFSGFLYLILRVTENGRVAWVIGWLYGIIVTASALAWFWHMPPYTWLGSSSYIDGAYFAGGIWILTSLLLGLSFAAFAVLIWLMRHHTLVLILIPLLHPLVTQLSMWLHTIIALGDNSLIEPHFSVIALGYAITENNFLLQFADDGGIASLDLVVAALAVIILATCTILTSLNNLRKAVQYLGIIVIIGFALTLPVINRERHDTSQQSTTVLVLATDSITSPTTFQDIREFLITKISDLPTPPQLIVLPEGYSLDRLFGDLATRQTLFNDIFGETEVIFVYTRLENKSVVYNNVTFESSRRGILLENSKRYLAPEGEYATYLGSYILKNIQNPLLQRHMAIRPHLAVGKEPQALRLNDSVIAGSLSCYEIFSPILYRSLTHTYGANILINTSDPTWFHNSPLYFEKSLQMARVHAVQNRAPFVLANKGAPSFIIDQQGHVVAKTKWNSMEHLYETLHIRSL